MLDLTDASHSPSNREVGSLAAAADCAPWDYLEQLRELGDVVWDEQFQAWIVLSYDLVREVALDRDDAWQLVFELEEGVPAPHGMTHEQWRRFQGFGSERFLAMLEGPVHDAQRKWMVRALSAQVLKLWRETRFAPIADELIDRFIERGHAELNAAFADLLAPKVITSIMGPALPYHDDAFIHKLGELMMSKIAVKQQTGNPNTDPALIERGLEAHDELVELLLPYILEGKDGAGDDMISMVWRDADTIFAGDDWGEIDIVAFAAGMWEAGAHSTRNSTSNGIWLVLSQPELQAEIRENPDAARRVIEETLRMHGPVQYRPRRARRDVMLGGTLIRKGEQVLTHMVAAGRDPERYRCPTAVDLERESPRDHLQFYPGRHACPGQGLARAELEVALDRLFGRLKDVRLDPDAEQPHFEGLIASRFTPLHVRFSPGERLGLQLA